MLLDNRKKQEREIENLDSCYLNFNCKNLVNARTLKYKSSA